MTRSDLLRRLGTELKPGGDDERNQDGAGRRAVRRPAVNGVCGAWTWVAMTPAAGTAGSWRPRTARPAAARRATSRCTRGPARTKEGDRQVSLPDDVGPQRDADVVAKTVDAVGLRQVQQVGGEGQRSDGEEQARVRVLGRAEREQHYCPAQANADKGAFRAVRLFRISARSASYSFRAKVTFEASVPSSAPMQLSWQRQQWGVHLQRPASPDSRSVFRRHYGPSSIGKPAEPAGGRSATDPSDVQSAAIRPPSGPA